MGKCNCNLCNFSITFPFSFPWPNGGKCVCLVKGQRQCCVYAMSTVFGLLRIRRVDRVQQKRHHDCVVPCCLLWL